MIKPNSDQLWMIFSAALCLTMSAPDTRSIREKTKTNGEAIMAGPIPVRGVRVGRMKYSFSYDGNWPKTIALA